MYIPPHYRQEDSARLLGFMRQYPFAQLITARYEVPKATPLPFVVDQEEGRILLSSHLAKANGQWKGLEEAQVLVVFQEPHAYISPGHYEKLQNVPTWNYVAVHAYGRVRLVQDEEEGVGLLEKMIQFYESAYLAQWRELAPDYKLRMLRAIVPFVLEVQQLQGKEKLSQNRTATEQANIIQAFEASTDPQEVDIAHLMREASQN